MRRRRSSAVLTALVCLACLGTWSAGALLGRPWRGDVTTAALTASSLVAGVAAAIRSARSVGRARLGWLAIAASAALWACGEGMWAADALQGRPFLTPTPADPLFAASGPLLVLGMAVLAVRAPELSGRLLLAVDGLLVAVGALAVDWQVTVSGSGGTLPTTTIVDNALYVLGDVAAVAVGLMVIGQTIRYRNGGRVRWALGLLAAAGFAVQAGDGGYAFLATHHRYHLGSPVEAAYALHAGLLVAAAVLAPRRFPVDPAPPGPLARLLAPVTAVASGAVVATLAIGGTTSGSLGAVPAFLLALLLLLVGARQGLTSRDLWALARNLDRRVHQRTAELAGQERWFRALVRNSSDVVTVLDADGIVGWQSSSVAHLQADAVVGRTFLDVVDAADRGRAARILQRCLESPDGRVTGSFRVTGADGGVHHVEAVVQSLLSDPDVGGIVLTTRDVTERVELESKLADLAFHDPITGLPNRTLFADRVEHALGARIRDGQLSAVLFCDLDGFKTINDTLGHAVGDEVLRAVAGRFAAAVRPGDTVARLGGDEFAVLLSPLASPQEATEVAARLLDALATPVEAGGIVSHVGASIGIAATDDGDETVAVLLRNADLAMYRAKNRGGRRWHRYEPALLNDVTRRLDLETGLRHALDHGDLVVHYQPLVDLSEGRTTGVEALVRWQREGRLVPPVDFIPLAEETGLVVPLGAWVLREACWQASAWQAYGPLTVSVNVSVRQLTPELLQTVRSALHDSGLPAERLILEVTESAVVDNTEAVLDLVAALQAMGVCIAIDDFGTGYSSLAYLSRLPVDVLKVDRSFVTRLDTTDGAGMVAAIVEMARTLGLRITAEGIEAETQLDVLRALGVGHGQGYLFSRPVPPGDITTALADQGALAGAVGVSPAPPARP